MFPSSTNGIDEYTASNFGGKMKGDLIAAGYVLNEIYRIRLNAAGDAVMSNTVLFSEVDEGPLDLVALGDTDPFPGTIWVGDQRSGSILIFEPTGEPTSTGSGLAAPLLIATALVMLAGALLGGRRGRGNIGAKH